jgi:hypothetical protein
LARVRFTDNWILAGLSFLDPVLRQFGLITGPAFAQFESYRYERALGRGFGICSQNSEGLADLLDRRYGLNVRIVALGGHVVIRIKLPDRTRIIADPSLGIILPFSLAYAESHLDEVEHIYAATFYASLGQNYDHAMNVVSPDHGSGAYAAPFWRQQLMKTTEYVADILCVLLPLMGLIWLEIRRWQRSPARIRRQIQALTLVLDRTAS